MSQALVFLPSAFGFPIASQPFVFKGANVRVFVLNCDHSKLDAVVERRINNPSENQLRFRALAPGNDAQIALHVSEMSFQIRRPGGGVLGNASYRELGFWIPCYNERVRKPAFTAFSPLMFVDGFAATATGREMFGFDKQMGSFDLPPELENPALSFQSQQFETFGPDSEADSFTVIKVEESNETWNESGLVVSSDLDLPGILSNIEWFTLEGEKLGPFPFNLSFPLPTLLLKQVPSIRGAQIADMRQINTAPFRIERIRSPLRYRKSLIRFRRLESMPIVQELGIKTDRSDDGKVDTATSKFGCGFKLDFRLDTGETLVEVKA